MNTAEILQAHDGRFRLDSSPACYIYSFRGLHQLRQHPDWSLLGVKFKISDKHPHPFHMGVSPARVPPPGRIHIETALKLRRVHPSIFDDSHCCIFNFLQHSVDGKHWMPFRVKTPFSYSLFPCHQSSLVSGLLRK